MSKKTKAEKVELLKEKRGALDKKHEEENPYFNSGKKLVLYIVLFLIGFRAFHIVLQLIYLLINNIPLGYDINTIIISAASLWLLAMITMGAKEFSYIALLGGFWSIHQANRVQMLLNFNTHDSFFNFINIILHLAILFQIVGMLFIIFDKRTSAYFKSMKEITAEMIAWNKEQKGK